MTNLPADVASQPPAPEPDSTTQQRVFRGALAIALALLGLWTIRNFLPALVWAAILAIAVWPLYQRTRRRFPPRHVDVLLPSLFTLLIALIFLAPMAVLAIQIGREAHSVFGLIAEAQKSGLPVPGWLSGLPMVSDLATSWWRDHLNDPADSTELLHQVRSGLIGVSRSFGTQVMHRSVQFFFTLLTLFFLLRHGVSVADQIARASNRAFGPKGEQVARQIVSSVHGTVDGLVLVGIGEGVAIGIVYWLVGVPHPTLLGALTGVAAMIPFGAPVIFCIAALLLLAQGSVVAALIVTGFGFVVIMVADHAIRPALIGSATRLPFLWVLLGILGGVEVWGLLGLFLGPAIMAALVLLWREWVDDPTAA